MIACAVLSDGIPPSLLHFCSAVRPFGKRRLRGFFLLLAHSPSLFHTHFSPHSLSPTHTPSSSSTSNHGSPSRRLALGHQPLLSPHHRCPPRLLIHPLPRLFPRLYVQKKHTRILPLQHLLFFFFYFRRTRAHTYIRIYNNSAFDRFMKSRTNLVPPIATHYETGTTNRSRVNKYPRE